ncbi:Transglycosylase-associated protein [Beijerinckiaceae bacterium RH AL1]|jgi:uncharacterized membrane protein YeaQ/YmgE (transglycosylase-associated protein family)|nr:GlsB/YeaQ/YmgE family stress response membrane protein [Beijerinckiaceae bacterium]VVB45716.1 Transglycosylase-associated protein [Beijerinckiaceae bacterium RH CH11]VVB45791.1 Transglycosylase-associated protein [Beijerinckiaceae bacterium RH AL8]VVC55004.1 Transglycosylase-associated protein [Beijerinckiaceae bacterium RH AL1]
MILHYIWVVIVGFVAGLIARFLIPGPNNPSGFIMTAVLGIVGSFVANFIAVKIGWISDTSEGGQLLSGVVGAVIILAIYHFISARSASTTI